MGIRFCVVVLAVASLLGCSGHNAGFGGTDSPSGGPTAGDDAGASSSDPSTSGGGASYPGATSGDSGQASTAGDGASASSSSGGGASSGTVGLDGGGHGLDWGTQIAAGDLAQAVTLTATPFQVDPGAEVYKCQVFANPFGGVNTDIVSMHGTMSAGSHHFFLFNMTALETAVEPPVGTLGNCSGGGLEFHPFPFLSQQRDWTVNYPSDSNGAPMGYPLIGQNYLMINVHYLNTTVQPIMANVSITLTPARAGVVKTHVGSIFLNQTTMSVPPTATMQNPTHTTMIWGGDPGIIPPSYTILTSWSHMHRWGMKFTASTGSNTFYTETSWDSPNLFIHAPNMPEPATATGPTSPVRMDGNPPITWDCEYYNDTGAALGFGDSARSSVMCIYIGQYYPANPNAPDDVAVLN
jgi:hypothetical protein